MYKTAFAYGNYGYGSSIALLLSVFCLAVTVVIFRGTRKDLTT
jgi:multiple sugar transport system permease protein/raffinose/stachyose/melibiose transport system permease protein